jgi:hypothetical protein
MPYDINTDKAQKVWIITISMKLFENIHTFCFNYDHSVYSKDQAEDLAAQSLKAALLEASNAI